MIAKTSMQNMLRKQTKISFLRFAILQIFYLLLHIPMAMQEKAVRLSVFADVVTGNGLINEILGRAPAPAKRMVH